MAKKGMARPDRPRGSQRNTGQAFSKNDAPPVPELQGPAKLRNEKAKPITEP